MRVSTNSAAEATACGGAPGLGIEAFFGARVAGVFVALTAYAAGIIDQPLHAVLVLLARLPVSPLVRLWYAESWGGDR